MTDEMMTLRSMLEKGTDADVLREMIGYAAQRLMEMEVQAVTGAGHGERCPDRQVQRNGYRDRGWDGGAEGPHRAPARSSCAFPSCARERIFRASWNPGGWPRRR
jgi:hypothetical protein